MKNKNVKKGVIGRLLKTMHGFYPVMLPVTVICIVFSAVVSSVPAIFMQNIIAVVEENWQNGDWEAVSSKVFLYVGILVVFYILSLTAGFAYNQLMAIMTQGTLKKLREKMFNGMQRLPIKYFDTNNHGDIMSRYTNDIGTLRQMISQSFPQLLIFFNFSYYSFMSYDLLLFMADLSCFDGRCNYVFYYKENRRRFGKIFLSSANGARKG